LSSSMNFERWSRQGALDASARATAIYEKTLEVYERPPLDDAIRQELEDYVNRRRTELGD
jgi:trimethylamine---corrinoid protein Co-methyltransferase